MYRPEEPPRLDMSAMANRAWGMRRVAVEVAASATGEAARATEEEGSAGQEGAAAAVQRSGP